MIENRLLRLLVALTAGIVMGLVSSFMSYRASAAPVHHAVAHRVPAVQINAIYFDSPGTDSGSNASLNAEWVRIKNANGLVVDRCHYTEAADPQASC